MRNLKDIIQEVLVHQHATKDTKSNEFNYSEKIDIVNIIKGSINAEDIFKENYCIYTAHRGKSAIGICDDNKVTIDKGDNQINIPCKLYIFKDNIFTPIKMPHRKTERFELLVDATDDIRYCTEEECNKLYEACKEKGIKL